MICRLINPGKKNVNPEVPTYNQSKGYDDNLDNNADHCSDLVTSTCFIRFNPPIVIQYLLCKSMLPVGKEKEKYGEEEKYRYYHGRVVGSGVDEENEQSQE